jgi:hypothetical protein
LSTPLMATVGCVRLTGFDVDDDGVGGEEYSLCGVDKWLAICWPFGFVFGNCSVGVPNERFAVDLDSLSKPPSLSAKVQEYLGESSIYFLVL